MGARRWQESTLLDSWTPRAPNIVISDASPDPMRLDWSHHGGGPLNATTFAPSCYTLVTGGSWIRSEPESEDCLALNVYIPAGHVERMQKTGALLPVVLWLHGGGFIMGSSSNPSVSPPPDLFVSEAQVVFVSINYRQGPFGFLSSSAMPDFGGMLGIGDQVSSAVVFNDHDHVIRTHGLPLAPLSACKYPLQTNAMRWIQRYIAYFGGDKNKVTVMGESAGAISICSASAPMRVLVRLAARTTGLLLTVRCALPPHACSAPGAEGVHGPLPQGDLGERHLRVPVRRPCSRP